MRVEPIVGKFGRSTSANLGRSRAGYGPSYAKQQSPVKINLKNQKHVVSKVPQKSLTPQKQKKLEASRRDLKSIEIRALRNGKAIKKPSLPIKSTKKPVTPRNDKPKSKSKEVQKAKGKSMDKTRC